MPIQYYLVLSFVLFLIGTAGVLLRRNALIVLMGIELQLNGGNLALLAFSRQLGDLNHQPRRSHADEALTDAAP
jgi:NADH-quinone oxidoreductase subunit K